jgi:hypothetical protein
MPSIHLTHCLTDLTKEKKKTSIIFDLRLGEICTSDGIGEKKNKIILYQRASGAREHDGVKPVLAIEAILRCLFFREDDRVRFLHHQHRSYEKPDNSTLFSHS